VLIRTKEVAMAWKTRVLVLANRTADSDELHDYLCERAEQGPLEVTLVAPAGDDPGAAGGSGGAFARLEHAKERLGDAGIPVTTVLGDADPCIAAAEAWDPRRYDEIVVCTLPAQVSRWLGVDLPRRVARLADAPVHHVIAHPRIEVAAAPHAPVRQTAIGRLRPWETWTGRFVPPHETTRRHG
jgi:hypothetical protein